MHGNIQAEWTSEHVIRSYDVDPRSTARLSVLCRFMQDAAYFHAEHLGLGHGDLSRENMTWVLSRMRIEVERLPKWGETIKLRTWPSGRDRLFYYRGFEITDEAGGLSTRASTAWFVIDLEKRERVTPDWWTTGVYPIGPKVLAAKLTRLKEFDAAAGDPVAVNYGDLDQNGHVSNIRYVEWILNSLPLEFHQRNAITTLEVDYLAEALYGHSVSIRGRADGSTLDHAVSANGADLFRARSVWKSFS